MVIQRVWVYVCAALLVATAGVAQMPEEYLDVLTVKVRPEKRSDFDAVVKKMVAANRNNDGDTWVTMERAYGENNVVTFISTRSSYADIEKGSDAFMRAANKAFGAAGAQTVLQGFNNAIASSWSEVRRRRWDLSANAPSDPAAAARLVGESRWVRTSVLHVRPGHLTDVESLLKEIKAARERTDPRMTTLVSQGDSGNEGAEFYVSRLVKSFGELDGALSLPKLLGEESYQKLSKSASEAEERVDTWISRFLPELSNPPKEVVAASPDFWTPNVQMAEAGATTKSKKQ